MLAYRDLRAGIASGLKSFSKGVVTGAVSLIAAPIAGASSEGVTGLFKGLGVGLVAAVALPFTGLAVGAYQVVRGVVNEPEASKPAGKQQQP